MFVDERGEFVQPDYLIPIVARATASFSSLTGGKIIHDVRTSRGVVETLKEDGFEPVMVPVGHAFAKPALRTSNAICGGELAGHYYFSEFFCCDSGVLAATRILGEAAKAIARVLKVCATLGEEVSRSEIDGVRVDYADGWVSVRKSNTEPYLRLIVECREETTLKDWCARLSLAVKG